MRFWRISFTLAALAATLPGASARPVAPETPEKSFPGTTIIVSPDALEPLRAEEVQLQGCLGRRVAANVKGRLLAADETALLAGFRQRPGSQAWIGEHVGKWMDAASRAYRNTRDPALRAKLLRVCDALMATQEKDGYLGTYLAPQRFGLQDGADWDVWVHRYGLLGLISTADAIEEPRALHAAQRGAQLLLETFAPGKKKILAAGTHSGLAATSVMETMVYLYRSTRDRRYLGFAEGVRISLDEPGGPELTRNLTIGRPVSQIANGKAYEILANLVGLCELARERHDPKLLEPVHAAWDDIVARRLYITGTASAGEHFRGDHQLPNNNAACVGETCVTASWIELNAQLLRLTGRSRYAEQIERSVYNHLLAAQRPDGARWCVYTPLQGWKPFSAELTCCLSSGSRALTLLPELAYFRYRDRDGDGLCVNFIERSRLTTPLGGQQVFIEQSTEYPVHGASRLTVRTPKPAAFSLRIRVPAWTQNAELKLRAANTGTPSPRKDEWKKAGVESGWLEIARREWRDGDSLEIRFGMNPRWVKDEPSNPGRTAAMWGPLVLALGESSPGAPRLSPLDLRLAQSLGGPLTPAPGSSLRLAASILLASGSNPQPPSLNPELCPIADVGADGSHYQVWLRAPGTQTRPNPSLLGGGHESRSRIGGQWGEIIDGDPGTFAGTYNGRQTVEDWFAVSLRSPVSVRRVVFMHGQATSTGGWFDTSAGRPRIQAVRTWGGRWEDVAQLSGYPSTNATEPSGLKPGQAFTARLAAPVRAIALRVIGKPASGHSPGQNSATCAELQAFAD